MKQNSKVVQQTKGDKATADRRGFLKMMSVGALTGGAALGARGAKAATGEADIKDGTLYRETEHVRTYYDLAKF